LVGIGFEPKIAFLCPLCHKEVEILYEKGKDAWTSEHSNCLNFTVVRDTPEILGRHFAAPLVFIKMESDFSIKEAVEGLRNILKEEGEGQKRLKIEMGIRRLESRLGFVKKNLTFFMDALRSGSFGLKVISGKDVQALLWKSGDRYIGVAEPTPVDEVSTKALLASGAIEEAERFAISWLSHWDSL